MVSRLLFASLTTLHFHSIVVVIVVVNTFSAPLVLAPRGRRRKGGLRNANDDGGSSHGPLVASNSAKVLHKIASTQRNRVRGSKNVIKGWLHWRTLATDALRRDLSSELLPLVGAGAAVAEDLAGSSRFEELHC